MIHSLLKQKYIFLLITCLSFQLQALPTFKKVMIVILENTDYTETINLPFLSTFAKNGSLLENMTAETHPSQGNYIALTSGDLNGVKNDNDVNLNTRHIADLLEAKGLTWKVYAEDYPGNCFLGTRKGLYVRKHVPFLSYKNVTEKPDRCKNIVDASVLMSDIKNNSLPDYSIFIPNLKNDGHDTSAAFADQFLAKTFGPLLKTANFMNEMLLIITFDEAKSKKSVNKIYTALLGDDVVAGSISKTPYTHYSLLRTIELAWGLGSLGKNDDSAKAITDVLRQ